MIPRLGPHQIPALGFGTYQLKGPAAVEAVRVALQAGYRLLDTAAVYRNEKEVGEGVAASGVPRSDLFIVVKIAMKSMGSQTTIRTGILESLSRLQLEYADCVLLHWPGCGGKKPEEAEAHRTARRDCWEVLLRLQKEGKVRFMGVSNFLPRHFTEIEATIKEAKRVSTESGVMEPILNQIELHPLCVQEEVAVYCKEKGIQLQQYSPLGKGDVALVHHSGLLKVKETYFTEATSTFDLLLMYGLAQGYSTLVRSSNPDHIQGNYNCAVLYFRSVWAQEHGEEHPSKENEPLLSRQQLEVIQNLRWYMGIEGDEDTHLCWWSNEIL